MMLCHVGKANLKLIPSLLNDGQKFYLVKSYIFHLEFYFK